MAKKKTPKKAQKHNRTKILFVSFMLLLASLSFYNLSSLVNVKPRVVYGQDNTLEQRIYFWETFLLSHPDYFEGWIELSELKIMEGKMKEAIYALDKAKNIDPNSEKISILEAKL